MREICLLVAFTLLGCGQTSEPRPSDNSALDSSSHQAVTTPTDSAASVDATSAEFEPDSGSLEPVAADHCKPGPGTTGTPQTVTDVVQLINGLPHPVTIPCFLQSLTRPLRIFASTSFVSAQPAYSVDNPRIFVLGEGISLSVVPIGDSGKMLELGELIGDTRSIKAEVEFPVTEQLSLDAAFTRIHLDTGGGTVCYGCHGQEVSVPDYPVAGAFESVAYRPLPELEVNFEYVEYQYITCDAATEPERCAFYAALFDQGAVLPGEFPVDMPLFQ